tara:strand:+ start:790 stop:1710 length:921 start_codon:yes stop_codon:yes gene_type:complete
MTINREKKNILIIGGTGFIGFHLAKQCIKRNWKVTSFSTSNPKKSRRVKKVKYEICDISDIKKLHKKTKNLNFNFIVNLGGHVDHKNKVKTLSSHFLGVKNLYKVFKDKKITKFIQIGSSSEYGKLKSPQQEKKIAKPKLIYGIAKLKASKFLVEKYKKKKFPVNIVRFYQLFGPNQDDNRFIPQLINSSIKKKVFLTSSGEQSRDFLYVDDGVDAIIKCLINKKINGKIFNIGSGKPIKLKEIMLLVKNKLNFFKPIFGEIKLRKDEPKIIYPDIKLAKKELNWKSRVKFESGLNKTIKYYKKLT